VVAPFRLGVGDLAPRQQSPTTCGSASLTVARMLADPAFAHWVRTGLPREAAAVTTQAPDAGGVVSRFAAYEQVVAARTNGLAGPGGRLQLPWPRSLGTPPWGAARELELALGRRHRVRWVRQRSTAGLGAAFDSLRSQARTALLYVGSPTLPRHVVLVLPGDRGRGGDALTDHLTVYEPSAGRVLEVHREPFAARRLALAGWDVPWATVCATPASR
jgi:hypothetical protein